MTHVLSYSHLHYQRCNPLDSKVSKLLLRSSNTMSSTCGNCDCADKSQCVKKGSSYTADIVETEKSFVSTVVMEVPAAAENDGKCKCGSSCTCTGCTCGH